MAHSVKILPIQEGLQLAYLPKLVIASLAMTPPDIQAARLTLGDCPLGASATTANVGIRHTPLPQWNQISQIEPLSYHD